MAAAYCDGSFLVVDLRGPRVLSRHVQNIKKETALHSVLRHSESADPVGSLTWTITGLGRSTSPFPRYSVADQIVDSRLMAEGLANRSTCLRTDRDFYDQQASWS
jgi:hypothetical protein